MKKLFSITAFLLILTGCINQGNDKKDNSGQAAKTDQIPSKANRVDSLQLLVDSFEVLRSRQIVILDSLESIQKKSKVKNPELDKRFDEELKKYILYETRVAELTVIR